MEKEYESINLNDNNKDMRDQLKSILEKSTQEGDFTNLKKEFCEAYAKFPKEEFQNNFKILFMTAFCAQGKVLEIKRLFNFISECAIKLDNDSKKENTNDIDSSQNMHPFLSELFHLLSMWSKANSSVVRSHSHTMLSALLMKFQEFGLEDIDVSVFEKIAEVVQRGRKDICASVRAQAVLLAKFIQDPSVEDDVIINGLCWQLESDPSFKVRQNILEILAPCEETVVPVLERCLYDRNEHVRNAGLLYISDKINPQSFRKDQRCLILHHCMFDNSKLLRKTAENRLIPVWLRAYGDKLSSFLSDLHLKGQQFENLRFLKKLLTILIGSMTLSQIIDDIGLDKEFCVPTGTLTSEKAFIWRTFCEIASQDKKYAKYLPTSENYTSFVVKYFKNLSDDDDPCVCHELIKLQIHFQEKFQEENWPDIVSSVFDLVRNPLVSKLSIPVSIKYLRDFYSQSETSVQEQLIQTVSAFRLLYQAVPLEQKSNIMLKCITIVSEMFNNDIVIWISDEIKPIKDNIILPLIRSDNEEIRKESIRALTLYCLLDVHEAKSLWNTLHENVSKDGSYCSLKGVFDVLLHYGPEFFDNQSKDYNAFFDDIVNNLVHKAFMGKEEEQIIITDGTLKLYLAKKIHSSDPLSQLMQIMYLPDSPQTIQIRFGQFLLNHQKLKLDNGLLTRAYINVLETLFHASKTSPLFKICIKTVVNSLFELSKISVNQKDIFNEEGTFMDMVSLVVTKNYLQKAGRLSSADLQSILSQVKLTSNANVDELRKNISLIVKQLDGPTSTKKRCFHTKKFFFNFLKNIPPAPTALIRVEEALGSVSEVPSDNTLDIQSVSSEPEQEVTSTQIPNLSDTTPENLLHLSPIEGTQNKLVVNRNVLQNRSALFTLSPIMNQPDSLVDIQPVSSPNNSQPDSSPIRTPQGLGLVFSDSESDIIASCP